MTHTPGPYRQTVPPSSCMTDRWIEDEDGRTLAEVGSKYCEHETINIHEHVSNAKLFAAAPELHNSMIDLLEWLDREFNVDGFPVIERAHAAIIKATT